MRTSPVSVTTYLDPSHRATDVAHYALEQALGGAFMPMYHWDRNRTVKVSSDELDRGVMHGTVVESPVELPDLEGDEIELAGGFSIGKTCHGHFQLPLVGDELDVQWGSPQPALTMQVIYHEYGQPTLYATFTASHGLWGNRSGWVGGMSQVMRELSSGTAENWAGVCEDLVQVEAELGVSEFRTRIWDAARLISNEFGNGKRFSVRPDLMAGRRPVDLNVHRPAGMEEEPLVFDASIWLAQAWSEGLSWNAPNEFGSEVMDFWSRNRTDDEFDRTFAHARAGDKALWTSLVEVLKKRPRTDWTLSQLMGFVADPNWPGAGLAWSHLVDLGSVIEPQLRAEIARALEIDDAWWAENLQEILDEISGEEE